MAHRFASDEIASAVADALANAADELDEISNSHTEDEAEFPKVDEQAGQMRNDARWLRKKAVAIRADVAGL